MSSTATTFINSINANYPVPGVDNDTQGFRDNYSNIKNSLTTLAGEVSGLQLNGVVVDGPNNFSYEGFLTKPILDSYVESINEETVSIDTEVSAIQGNYQKFNVGASLNFNVVDWSDTANVKSNVVLEIYNNSGSTATINFSNTLGSLKKDFSLPVSVVNSGTVFLEAWTVDEGVTVFLRQIGGSFV